MFREETRLGRAWRTLRRWPAEWWMIVPEPRIMSVLAGLMYAALFTMGLFAVSSPPQSFSGVGGVASMQIAGWLLMVGALISMSSGFFDFWELERVGLVAMSLGVTVYGSIVVTLQVLSDGGSRYMQISLIVAMLIALAARLAMVWKYPWKPREVPPDAPGDREP